MSTCSTGTLCLNDAFAQGIDRPYSHVFHPQSTRQMQPTLCIAKQYPHSLEGAALGHYLTHPAGQVFDATILRQPCVQLCVCFQILSDPLFPPSFPSVPSYSAPGYPNNAEED